MQNKKVNLRRGSGDTRGEGVNSGGNECKADPLSETL